MNRPVVLFCAAVIALDLFAIVYFSATWLTTGHVLAHAEEPNIIVAAAKIEGAGGHKKPAQPEPEFDWANFVPDVAKGAKVAAKCKTCHTFDAGGANRTGPALWGIFGKPIAAVDGFRYSGAFEDKKGEIVWDEQHLSDYLENPRKYIKGTKMAFPGLKKPEDRANLIAWLKTLQ